MLYGLFVCNKYIKYLKTLKYEIIDSFVSNTRRCRGNVFSRPKQESDKEETMHVIQKTKKHFRDVPSRAARRLIDHGPPRGGWE